MRKPSNSAIAVVTIILLLAPVSASEISWSHNCDDTSGFDIYHGTVKSNGEYLYGSAFTDGYAAATVDTGYIFHNYTITVDMTSAGGDGTMGVRTIAGDFTLQGGDWYSENRVHDQRLWHASNGYVYYQQYQPAGTYRYTLALKKTGTTYRFYRSGSLLGTYTRSDAPPLRMVSVYFAHTPGTPSLPGYIHSISIEGDGSPLTPAAQFSASPTTGTEPLTVNFTDTSTGDPTAWHWNFGDGYTSNEQNPTHLYLHPGQYSVSLTAANDHGHDTAAKPYYITVNTQKVKPTADFSASRTTGPAPLTVTFTDESTGNPTSWSWEFGDGLGSNARNPTHTYIAPGTYTVILTAYNSVGSDVKTRTEYITVENIPQPADAGINGYAFDNINNVLVDGATITIENETYSDTNITHGGGFYQFTGLTGGTYTIKGEKAGYLTSPEYAVQLYSGAVVQRDVFLGVSGVAIVGTVYDAVTGDKLNGANVTATQGTASYSSTGAGQYALNGLSKGVETTITASLAGYTHTPVTLTPTSGAPYTIDLYLIPDTIAHNGPALAGLVTDAATHKAIPNAQVSLPGSANATTSPTGFYLFDDHAPGSYYVSASAAGYYPSHDYAVTLTEGNLTWQEIALSPSATASTGYGAQYPPHNVKFTVLTLFGGPIPGVNVSAQGFEQTPSPNLIERLLGIDMTSTPINSELMSGTTDTNGEINFMMIEAIKYRIQLYKPDVVNQTLEIYPKEDTYPIIISTAGGPLLPDAGDALRDIHINVTTSTGGDTGHIHIDYNDTTRKTTGLSIQVTQQNATDPSAPEEVIASHTVANDANVTHTFDLDDYKGKSYFVRLEAQHPDFGTVHRDYAAAFKGVRVPLGPLPDGLYIYVAGFGLMLLGGIFGATSATRGVVVIAFAGWLFYAFGWLDDLGLIAPASLGLVSTIAVMGVIVTRYREEGYT